MDAAQVRAVTAVVGDISEDQVRRVLTAVESLRDGATPGTIVQDPKTGAVALRVSEGGVDYWSVTDPSGAYYRDMQPQLPGWREITKPAAKTSERAAK
jgi:hypothetical protein